MQLLGLQVKNILISVCGFAAGLFDKERHRVGFIHQTELAGFGRIAVVARVHENTAAAKDTMNFCNHCSNPAHIEVLAQRTGVTGQKFLNILLNRSFPMSHVGHVDRKFLGLDRNTDVFLRKDVLSGTKVQREHENAGADG